MLPSNRALGVGSQLTHIFNLEPMANRFHKRPRDSLVNLQRSANSCSAFEATQAANRQPDASPAPLGLCNATT